MRLKIALLSLFLFILPFKRIFSQSKITGYKLINKSVSQFGRADWDINVVAEFKNPYLQEDIALDMLLTTPSGKRLVLPCYFQVSSLGDSSLWKARFLPQEDGKYEYRFQLKKSGKIASTSRPAKFAAASSVQKGILHKNNLWTFKYDNGELYRGLGENLCWESRDNDDSKFFKELHENKKYNYNYMLPSLAGNGGDYFRTWICSWNLPIDWQNGFNNSRYQPSDEYFNPSAVEKLDSLVKLSDSLGLHMMLTLGEGTHDARHGRYQTSTADFFINQNAKAQYKNRLRFIVARWGYSPSIGAWEFFNEIDNIQFRNSNNPIKAANIVQWHEEMSAFLAELDPYDHLITTSISHRDLEGLNSIKNIDFNQKHIYKNNRALPVTIVKYSNDFQKPYVIGEFGYEYDWQKNFNLFADEMDSDFKRGLWYGLFSPTPILPLSWWWEFFDNRGTDAYLANVRAILDEMMFSGKGSFERVNGTADEKSIEIYSVRCGDKTFIYVYNPTDLLKRADISLAVNYSLPKNARIYDCETGESKNQKMKLSSDNKIQGLEVKAKSDIVLIL